MGPRTYGPNRESITDLGRSLLMAPLQKGTEYHDLSHSDYGYTDDLHDRDPYPEHLHAVMDYAKWS